MHSKDLDVKRHTFVYARIQKSGALTWGYGHFVGAYGVVGFSGVKDARRESFLADASASAAFLAVSEQICNKQATKRQREDNARTALRQLEGNRERAQ